MGLKHRACIGHHIEHRASNVQTEHQGAEIPLLELVLVHQLNKLIFVCFCVYCEWQSGYSGVGSGFGNSVGKTVFFCSENIGGPSS